MRRACPSCLERFDDAAVACPDHPDLPLLAIDDPAEDPLIGQALDGRYVVLAREAEGGMATVYRAWQRATSRVVAVKTVPPERADDTIRARFIRESRVTANLRSPHAVTVFDSGALSDGTLYMVMEHLRGDTLEAWVRAHGALPIHRVRRHGLALCDALAEAHAAGLVHRDLKPANLMLSSRPGGRRALVVLDFGIAKVIDATAGDRAKLTRDGAALGSLGTMSPEQIHGDPVGPASDIYAAGAVLYFMAAGALPFDGPSALSILSTHPDEPAPRRVGRLDDTPATRALDAVVQRCLEKDPARRFASAEELRDALRRLPVSATGTHHRVAPPPRGSTAPRLPIRGGTDPAALPGVSTAAVHRRITGRRLRPAGGRPASKARRIAWWTTVVIALALGTFVALDGLLSSG